MNTINDRIAYLIKDLGITKTKFAETINLSQPFVSAVCSGSKMPSDRTISDICREFNVSLAWLEDGEGEMYVQRSENERMALMFTDVLAEADESTRHCSRPRNAPGVLGQHPRIRKKNHRKQITCFRCSFYSSKYTENPGSA